MTFTFEISTAVVSAIVGGISGIIVALATRKGTIEAARIAANNEIDKLQKSWIREDAVSFDAEFSEMIRMAILFALRTNIGQPDTLATIGMIRAKESGDLAITLDKLYRSVKTYSYDETYQLIDEAIALKRAAIK